MRLLLDECLPRPLRRELSGHEVKTVQEMGWAGTKNGDLLRLAVEAKFEGLITLDRGIEHQQHLPEIGLGVVLLRAASNDISDLLPLVPELLDGLKEIRPGAVLRVGSPNL